METTFKLLVRNGSLRMPDWEVTKNPLLYGLVFSGLATFKYDVRPAGNLRLTYPKTLSEMLTVGEIGLDRESVVVSLKSEGAKMPLDELSNLISLEVIEVFRGQDGLRFRIK